MKIKLIIFLFLGFLIVWTVGSFPTGDNPHGNIDYDCELCHSAADWSFRGKNIDFKHDKTGYPLLGAHDQAMCRSCHESLIFAHIGVACIDCHTDIHAGELGLDCQNCHTPVSWENRFPVWEEHNITRFALLGFHALLDCESCHRGPAEKQFTNLPVDCNGCHNEDYVASRNPDHRLAEFDMQCEECHSPVSVSWQQVQYIHPASFALQGAHLNTDCISCHSTSYTGTPNQCEDCHMPDYQASVDPDHVKFGFPTICARCHNESSWQDATFDHLAESGFALIGAHSRIQCTDCHVNNQISGLPQDCYGCHENDFAAVMDPNHVSNNIDHNCLDCHSQEVWSPSTFDHNNTIFPLTGSHLTVNCISCHENGYASTPIACYDCHDQDYAAVPDPNHVTNNFNHDCMICHNTSVWSPAEINHNNTAFPLTGAHVTVNCISCHENGYAGTPIECFACHEPDFAGVPDPNHVTNNFNHDCMICHNTSVWSPADIDHNNTGFPLTGAHVTVNCISCHENGYAGTPIECYACHEPDFAGVSDPNHVSNNFDHDCTICHNTSAWSPADFDHNNTGFPLTGAHLTTACSGCHETGYTNIPVECVACHQTEYDGTTDPDHLAAAFPTTCENCHNTTAWDQTTWDHDSQYFPIYSGSHQDRWNNSCAECHLTPSSYKLYECIFCHEHNQTSMDEKHRGEGDYRYLSTACYTCHPDGRTHD